MTHTAWVPKSWLDAARGALAGLADAHPSRTILLVPDPDAERDAIDASVSVYCFDLESEADHVCSEVVELHLYGCRAESPASIIEPLLISDLPVFSRWRGRPPFGSRVLEEMVHVVDRLIVDSSEWDDVSGAYEELPKVFDQTAVSDIAFRRSLRWRALLAELWPGIADARRSRSRARRRTPSCSPGGCAPGSTARSRWSTRRRTSCIPSRSTATPSAAPRADPPDPSQLLSAELDQFGRDPIYEAAVRAAT